jgi:pimeloyl-ACP methyl ester carboxylesterase
VILACPGAAPATAAPLREYRAAGRHFLDYNPSAGTAVEVLGNLATASHVAVLVPGVDTTFADFDRGLDGVARRAPAVQARNLYSLLLGSSLRVAVVAWLGYHPPRGLGLDAAREDVARSGAQALTSFVRGIAAPGRQITLVGHSYGAIVVGLAAARLPFVRDLVTLGAPGMGVDRASQLGEARVWSALAEADWIRRVPEVRVLDLGHGRRPSSPGFGSVSLPSDGVAGHDYYLAPGSVTLAAVANVVLYSSRTAPARTPGHARPPRLGAGSGRLDTAAGRTSCGSCPVSVSPKGWGSPPWACPGTLILA